MQNDEMTTAREWLTVDEVFLACQAVGLDRTRKAIWSWARNEHVEGMKQTTPTGERWMVEKKSLDVKIRSELEFQHHIRRFRPVRTCSHGRARGRTRSNRRGQ